MSDLEQFSTLIGKIYDASLDPTLWPEVFEKASSFIGATAACLGSQDTVRRTANYHYSWGSDVEFERLYVEQYCRLNPVFPAAIFFSVEQVYDVPDCIPRDEFCRSRFAREWLAPQGWIDGLLVNLDKSATSCAVFMVCRHFSQGIADEETRRRFSLVVPHMRRALTIGQVIDLKKVEAVALADSLDTLSSAMFLVDASGRIVHANLSGHGMVAEGNVLRARGGKLTPVDAQADRLLLDALTAASAGDAAVGRKGIALPLHARDGTRHVANVLPLTSGVRREAGLSYSAIATVFVHKAALDLTSPPEAIAQEFSLTPAELRVLFSIVDIGGVAEVAEVLGVSEATVKTHLHHVFAKTGTGRQADLVKLVAGYANALTR